jgi:hypothetical protein
MPTAMTFSSLQTLMQSYLERGTPSDTIVNANLPALINLAERAIARRLKIQGFLVSVVSAMQGSLAVYPKPDRWRQTTSMSYASDATDLATEKRNNLITESGVNLVIAPTTGEFRTTMLPRSLEYCQTYWPDLTLTGPPKFYADYDYLHWLVVPTPDLPYPWQINYYQLPALLDATNQTNWLTQFAPNLLLYRALLEATPFLKNDERIQVWQQYYQDELNATNTEDLQRAADRAAVRNEP